MKSKLFFLPLSTALAIRVNANAVISIGTPSLEDSNKTNSVSYFDEDTGENVEHDLSTFLKNDKFNPFSEDGQSRNNFGRNLGKPDNGGSDLNNGNHGSSGGEETKPDTGSNSGTGSSTDSSSGTTSGSGSSTIGTTTMPTGHRTFYAPAEVAADVHEGKDNTVIISF